MRLVLLGPPGAGKGTHAKVLSEKFKLAHLATGDILRAHIRNKTKLGVQAKDIIERGELVSDTLVNAMMFEEIRKVIGDKGFILDGYPRTIGQAEGLDKLLKEEKSGLDAVLNFETSEAVIIDRLSGRRVAPSSGRVYHIRNMPPKRNGFCDVTGEALVTRKDDEPETVRNRLKVYQEETSPLVAYYQAKGLLYDVPGDYDVPELQEELTKLFDRLRLAV